MKLIALDSSGLVASVAVVTQDAMIAEYTVNYKKTHSQTLLPMLDEITKMIELDLSQIDAIAIAAGPGSFTGLRIGSATAKGLGLALDKPIVPVSTVDALAYNLYATDKIICPIMDARRSQVYTGIYEFMQDGTNQFHVIEKACVVMIEEIAEKLNQFDREVIFLGDGVPVFKDVLPGIMKVPFSFAPAHLARQRAGCVGVLGMEKFAKGDYETAQDHSPEYLRLSQAERERQEAGLL